MHDHYDHYSAEMIRRLDGFFGTVDASMNEMIAEQVLGTKILEVGCGFGTLVECLRVRGLEATGIDAIEFCVTEGRRRFPHADLRHVDSSRLPFPDQSFDTIVLKDTLHHIVGESDPSGFLAEVKRVAKRRLVISDPNPTAILLLARKLIRHVDPVCTPKQAARLVAEAGLTLVDTRYSQIFAFPLSGGYVGKPLVPSRWKGLHRFLLKADSLALRFLRGARLSHALAWRYLQIVDLPGK